MVRHVLFIETNKKINYQKKKKNKKITFTQLEVLIKQKL